MRLSEDWLEISGGFAGTAARVTDIWRASEGLVDAAAEMEKVANQLQMARVALEWASAGTRPQTEELKHAAQRALLVAEVARGGAGPIAANLNDSASRLAATARAYVEAERGASIAALSAAYGWDLAVGLASFARGTAVAFFEITILGRVPTEAVPNVRVTPGRDLTEAMLGVPDVVFAAATESLTEAMATIGNVVHSPFGIAISATSVAETTAPAGLGQLISRVGALEPRNGAEPGSLAVERLVHADGSISWIVEIPGTQELFDVGGENVFDNLANGQQVQAAMGDPALAVISAMDALGVGPDEPVLLVGHSQGGLTALALAAQPAFTSMYSLSAVVTAGTPGGRIDTPSGVQVLHLEHREDFVPGLDGAKNPDTPDRITVERSLGESSVGQEQDAATGSVSAHQTEFYVRTGSLVDGSTDSSLAQWRRRTEEFFAEPGTTATVTTFRVERGADATPGPAVDGSPLPSYVAATSG